MSDKSMTQEWQTIETCPDNGDLRLYAVEWVHHVNNYRHWEYYALNRDDADGSLLEMSGDHFSTCEFSDFTHWMPLPQPPHGESK